MIYRLQKLTMTTGVLALVFILPMTFSAVIGSSDGRNGIVENYCSIPFWICISVFVICTAVTLLYLSLREKHSGWQQKLAFPVIAAVLAGIAVFVLYVQVVNPLRDIPYLNSPHTVSLADVSFYYSNISDSPTIEISGTDADGREETFSISRKEFKEGETLLHQAAKSGGAQAVTADITYLPYSETVLDMDMKITDAAKR
ncbi:MAG TPA: hypothetical protein IAA10_08085 [Candidatus Blautia intestinavium]|nr:hypothetical protein [Candidatus Blautia intestinavium]